jgi:hypothetical protein
LPQLLEGLLLFDTQLICSLQCSQTLTLRSNILIL